MKVLTFIGLQNLLHINMLKCDPDTLLINIHPAQSAGNSQGGDTGIVIILWFPILTIKDELFDTIINHII